MQRLRRYVTALSLAVLFTVTASAGDSNNPPAPCAAGSNCELSAGGGSSASVANAAPAEEMAEGVDLATAAADVAIDLLATILAAL